MLVLPRFARLALNESLVCEQIYGSSMAITARFRSEVYTPRGSESEDDGTCGNAESGYRRPAMAITAFVAAILPQCEIARSKIITFHCF